MFSNKHFSVCLSILFLALACYSAPNEPSLTQNTDYKSHIVLDSLKNELRLESDTLKKLELLCDIGNQAHITNDDIFALKSLNRAYSSLRASKAIKFRAGRIIRNIYFDLGDYNKALNYHLQLDWSQCTNWEAKVPEYFMSKVSYKLGDNDKSIRILKQSAKTMRLEDLPYWEMSFTNSLGVAYKNNGQIDSAWLYFNRAKSIYDEKLRDSNYPKESFIEGLILGNIAQVLALKNEHLKAIPLYKRDIANSLTPPITRNKKSNAVISLVELVTSLIKTNQLEQAGVELKIANELISSLNEPSHWINYYKSKRELSSALGDFESALYAAKMETLFRDSIDRINNSSAIRDMKALYSIETENHSKQEADEIANALNRELTRTKWTLKLSLILILLLVVIVIMIFWNRIKNRKQVVDEKIDLGQQEKLTKALEEKDILLREIHHRVKNNLQIISSLFFLQSKHIKDEVALGLIREGQSRLHVMSLIHQKLYQAEELNRIDFQEYISDLAKQILQMHHSDKLEIDISIEAREFSESLELAVPIGMILNELLTNSIKHAFAGRRIGHIQIGLSNQQSRMRLAYMDDGVGLAESANFANGNSLGMKLIRLLTNQLGGTIEFGDTDGFSLSIEFDHKSL